MGRHDRCDPGAAAAEERRGGGGRAAAARLADTGYEHLLEVIRPGVSEREIIAAFDYHTRRNGANKNFTLLATGRITPDDPNAFGRLSTPTSRVIQSGESVMLEMTPAVSGYWAQLVRTVNLGEPNAAAAEMQAACAAGANAAIDVLGPGVTNGEVGRALEEAVREAGYVPAFPYGHICGIDLLIERVLPDSDTVFEPNDTVIIHPSIASPDGEHYFFWGETYLVTTAVGGV